MEATSSPNPTHATPVIRLVMRLPDATNVEREFPMEELWRLPQWLRVGSMAPAPDWLTGVEGRWSPAQTMVVAASVAAGHEDDARAYLAPRQPAPQAPSA